MTGDQGFTIEGRLSAQRKSDALTADFRWTHAPPSDFVTLTSPLGQGIAELEGDASARRVEIRAANGNRVDAADWSALTERALGIPVPVDSIAIWIQGLALAESGETIERDGAGRARSIRADGWSIVFDYADASATRPARMRLSQADVFVRIVIDDWR